ncbi:hypothetical protein JD969_15670 [Planctomycetota bacterium]|nr:hypothetical protein JD969_15670 [Planctomycetota bacterium]
MRYLVPFIFITLIAPTNLLFAQSQSPTQPRVIDNQLLAQQVHEIFRVHCAECHNSTLEDPGGGFDFILNFQHLREDPAYITPNQPDQSYIWEVIVNNEMPPADEPDTIPLNPQQKQIVKQWIENGAIAINTPKTQTHSHETPIQSSSPTIAPPPQPFIKIFIKFLGQFHPPSTHFPIALLLIAAFAEFLLIITKQQSLKSIVRFTLWCGAFSALLAMSLGLLDAIYMAISPAKDWILDTHRILGIATTVWAFITLAFLELRTNKSSCKCRSGFRLLLFIGAILVSVTGFFGGALVYGIHQYMWPF